MNRNKYSRELQWWINALDHDILPWYRGETGKVWGTALPLSPEYKHPTQREDAAATFAATWSPYHTLLQMEGNHRCGRLLDIGCGPMLPAKHLLHDECWGADPLLERYLGVGFPVASYGAILLPFACEDLWMVSSDYFDTVVSNNALDHVDAFELVAGEMERVAKPDGMIRFRVDCHLPTATEPITLSVERIRDAFRRKLTLLEEEHHETLTTTLWTT